MLTLRRTIVAASRDIEDCQGHLDCAELALALGLRDEARLFFELSFIATGYDQAALQRQKALQDETGLWSRLSLRTSDPEDDDAGSPDLMAAAISLRRCLVLSAVEQARDVPSRPAGPSQSTQIEVEDLPTAVHALHVSLQQPFNDLMLASALVALQRHPLVLGASPIEEHVDAPLATLATLLAAKSMRHFLGSRYTLCLGSIASPALLHAAAGLKRSGLGCYFKNAGNIVPTLRSLIVLALDANKDDVVVDLDAQHTVALVAAGMNAERLTQFVEIIADEGLLVSLRMIAERYDFAVTNSDRSALWTLRDAAIDFGEQDLAISLQAHLVQLTPNISIETSILEDLQQGEVPKGYQSTSARRHLRSARRREMEFCQASISTRS